MYMKEEITVWHFCGTKECGQADPTWLTPSSVHQILFHLVLGLLKRRHIAHNHLTLRPGSQPPQSQPVTY